MITLGEFHDILASIIFYLSNNNIGKKKSLVFDQSVNLNNKSLNNRL